jgi:hypothetical protein
MHPQRRAMDADPFTQKLIEHESFLRKLAYKNTPIQTSGAFFDDSDMQADYFLLVIYDNSTATPLLSTRYYFDSERIAECLRGDGGTGIIPEALQNELQSGTTKVFLADRLSGNLSSSIYRENRKAIFSLLYSTIFNSYPECTLVLMVRKEPGNKLLEKYTAIDFSIQGSVNHKGKPHWIISRKMKTVE